jgi:hypothetical protein
MFGILHFEISTRPEFDIGIFVLDVYHVFAILSFTTETWSYSCLLVTCPLSHEALARFYEDHD